MPHWNQIFSFFLKRILLHVTAGLVDSETIVDHTIAASIAEIASTVTKTRNSFPTTQDSNSYATVAARKITSFETIRTVLAFNLVFNTKLI